MTFQRPADYVEPDVSDARVTRIWLGLRERLQEGSTRRLPLFAAVATLAVALGVALLVASRMFGEGEVERAPITVAKLATARDSLDVTLADGSLVKLAPQTKLDVDGEQPSAVSLALHRGEVWCDVPHRDGRRFSVHTAGVEVRVVGTRFSVKTSELGGDERVEVRVTRGAVEVRA